MRERAQMSGDKHSSAKTMYICLCLTPALYGSAIPYRPIIHTCESFIGGKYPCVSETQGKTFSHIFLIWP